jgi:hypothetical protein
MALNKPLMEISFDIARIEEAAQDYLDFIASDKFHADRMNDYEQAIVEAVMESLFGHNVYEYINKRLE